MLRESRDLRFVLALLLLSAWVVSWPAIAHAAARVIVPAGWSESAAAAPEAQRRARSWQAALGLRLAQVVSAPDDDRFAETIAVFERSEPVFEQAFASEAAAVQALADAVAEVVGTEPPARAELRRTSSGEPIAWARWTVDDLTYECVLAPSGETATIVIAAVLAIHASAERPTLSAVFEQLEGVSAPMPHFSLLGWRLGAIVLWLALALGVHALMLQLGDRENDHGPAGMRAAGLNLLLVIAGTAIAALLLREREPALIYAGSSLAGLAVWIGVAGLVVVGVHFSIASRLDRGQVQSAPSSGSFASASGSFGSGIYRTGDALRSSGSRSDLPRAPQEPNAGAAASQSQARIVVDDAELE